MTKRYCVKCSELMESALFDGPSPQPDGDTCYACRQADQQEQALVAQRKLSEDEATRLLRELSEKAETPALSEVLTEVYEQFGGAKGFARTIWQVIDNQLTRDKVPYQTAMIMTNLMRLQLHQEQHKEKVRVNDMTIEQIEAEMRREQMKTIVEILSDPSKAAVVQQMMADKGVSIAIDALPVDTSSVIVHTEAELPYNAREEVIARIKEELRSGRTNHTTEG